MTYVYQTNNQTGITYVYENHAYWDKEKKQSRAKRKLVGKLDPETGEIVPTRAYRKKSETVEPEVKKGPDPILTAKRSFYGATYLLNQISKLIGLTDDLKQIFPKDYKKILSIAYFLVLEDGNALSRFPRWAKLHKHPYQGELTSQRSSELFQGITEAQRIEFFKKQGKRRIEKEYLAVDTTSISSYSEALSQVKYGKNKDDDRLPQINLALIFGEESGLPFYYRKLAGNVSDVTIVNQLLKELDVLELHKVKMVFDRGFFSRANINGCFKEHHKFLIGVPTSNKMAKEAIVEFKDDLHDWDNLILQYQHYGIMKPIEWDYEQERPYKGDVLKEKRRAYLFVYYNTEKALQDETKFNSRMTKLYLELTEGRKNPKHQKEYDKYFTVTKMPKRGVKVEQKREAMQAAQARFGYFVLLSNDIKDPEEALSTYRLRDVVEKGYNDIKDRLNMRRFNVSNELSLNGKIFVEFISLILLSYIKKAMHDHNLFAKWTMNSLLDELDLIELLETPEHGKVLSEVTSKQRELYEALGVDAPSS
jgi:transposase